MLYQLRKSGSVLDYLKQLNGLNIMRILIEQAINY